MATQEGHRANLLSLYAQVTTYLIIYPIAMGSLDDEKHGLQPATLRFATPDHLPRAEDRAIYAMNKNKDIHELTLNLHDARDDPDLVTGADGLDVHGFAYIKHQSVLSQGDRWYLGTNMEDTYLREVEELVCRITGAKRAVVNNCAFRRKPVTMQNRSDPVIMKGSVIDKMLTRLPKDRCLGMLPCLSQAVYSRYDTNSEAQLLVKP